MGVSNSIMFAWHPTKVQKEQLNLEEACAQESDKISLLPMVCAFAQESLPYHCRGLDSNDVLYAGDEDYHRELQETGGRVIAGAVQVRSLPFPAVTPTKQKKHKFAGRTYIFLSC